jgi:hypothetical protein
MEHKNSDKRIAVLLEGVRKESKRVGQKKIEAVMRPSAEILCSTGGGRGRGKK